MIGDGHHASGHGEGRLYALKHAMITEALAPVMPVWRAGSTPFSVTLHIVTQIASLLDEQWSALYSDLHVNISS
jgi:hypothetical protein